MEQELGLDKLLDQLERKDWERNKAMGDSCLALEVKRNKLAYQT